MLSLHTNMAALSAIHSLGQASRAYETASQRLSSGLRVNSAKDDPAGLAIATRMDSQIRGMQVAQRNAGDAISLAQTADGALASVTENLQRMRELAVQSKNETLTLEDRLHLDTEYAQLRDEVGRVLEGTTFNGRNVLAGGAGALNFQVGPGNSASDTLTLNSRDLASRYSALTSVHASVAHGPAGILDDIDNFLGEVLTERATYGAFQRRLESATDNLATGIQNTSSARGRIMDADYAKESLALSKANVQMQAAIAMLAQANQQASLILSLLR